MANLEWQYQQNQFDNCSKSSYKLMSLIAVDHDAKLKAQSSDEEILKLFNYFHPRREAFEEKHSEWLTSKATHKGFTQLVKNYFSQLSADKIEIWDIQVQIVYRQKTPEYIQIFPRGRRLFQQGAYEQRILALNSLIKNIGDDEKLTAVKDDVVSFTSLLTTARDNQQEKEGDVSRLADELEEERIKCAKGMYYTLGGLMQKFVDKPEFIGNFYELENIRNTGHPEPKQAESITGTINANTKLILFEEGFTPETQFLFRNIGSTQLQFFVVASTLDPIPEEALALDAGDEIKAFASQLGTNGKLLLMVYNPDETNQGKYFVNELNG